MIKKAILVFSTLALAVLILAVSVRESIYAPCSFAAAKLRIAVAPAPTATITPLPKVEYTLAYPGVLPDSPIYKLKMIRDKVWLWLTTNALDRAELFLLYADKRIGAGKALIEGNQVSLGISTMEKGEKYLEQGVAEVEKLKVSGKDTTELLKKIRNASLKHGEIIVDLKEKVSSDGKGALEELLKFNKSLQERIGKI